MTPAGSGTQQPPPGGRGREGGGHGGALSSVQAGHERTTPTPPHQPSVLYEARRQEREKGKTYW